MNRRILVIEDELLSQDIITSLLRGQGHDVDVVSDGFAAIERARATRYDAMLVDYHLPDMDGYALGRLLREQHSGVGHPVLIGLTADSNGLAARRGSDAVFRAILSKPIKPTDLFAAIERLCPPHSEGSAMPDEPARPEDTRRDAASLWRGHGLARTPKAFASPPPSLDQAAALTLCFDLVSAEDAECVVLLERHGIGEALRQARRHPANRLPIIGFSPDHADICDGLFAVEDADSWRMLARTLGAQPQAALARPPLVIVSREPIVASPPDAPIPGPIEAVAETKATEPVAPMLRRLILGGIRDPLTLLRQDLAAQRHGTEPKSENQALTRQLALLDEALLAAGTIADALNVPVAETEEATSFNPAELVENAAAMIRDTRPAGEPQLQCRIEAGMPQSLRGNAHRLSQAVLTLLDDACSSEVSIGLRLDLSFREGNLTLRLTGATSDPIIEHSMIAQLRGLRRNMLERLVISMGGTLSWPSSDTSDTILTVPASVEASAGMTGASSEPAHVLLVDDGATSGQMLTLLLAQRGHRVCRVADGEMALIACQKAHPDLAVFDLGSGAKTRQHAFEALCRFQTAQPDMPVIVLTQDPSAQEGEQLAPLGLAAILAKPFLPDALEAAVAACMSRTSPAADASAIDHKVRAALTAALGEQTVERLTRELLEQIETATAAPDMTPEIVARLTELSGCAAMLGLPALAAHCTLPRRGGAIGTALRHLREALIVPAQSAA